MRAIDKKLLRDFRRLWAQALAIAVVLAGGVAILLMSIGMSGALDETRDTYYERNRFADVFADLRRAPLSLEAEIASISGVSSFETRTVSMVVLDIRERSKPAQAHIISLPDVGEPKLNLPLLRTGVWPDPNSTDEVVVNAAFAEANSYVIGDKVSANLNGQRRALQIVGTALSPEFIYTIGPGAMMPDNENFGIIWMPGRAASAAFDMTGAFNSVSLKLASNADEAEVIDALDTLLERYGSLGAYGRDQQISDSFISAEIKQLRVMAYILPPVFLGITVFLVNMVIGRIVALERSEIGLLKAVGYSDIEVCLHYLYLAALVALVGVGIGWALGGWLAKALAWQYARFFDFPFLIFQMSVATYLFAGLLGLAAATFGAVRAALGAARLAPAVAMSPPAPPRFKRSVIDRFWSAISLSQPSIMILRSLVRWPLRSAMTSLGLALAVSVLVAANFFPDSLERIIDTAFFQQNRQHAMLLFAEDQPLSAIEEVRRLPGVLQAEGQNFESAILRYNHREKRVAIEARQPNSDLSRVVDNNGRKIEVPEGGIVLSERLADVLGVEIGNLVDVNFLSGHRETHALPVTDTVPLYLGLGAYLNADTLNAIHRRAPRVTTVNVTLDGRQLDAFTAGLKDLPKVAGTIMMVENRRAFQDTIAENIIAVTAIYAALGIMITVGVAYNGARVQLSERARELASLRILGFTRGEVSYILVGETMLLALLAQPLGWWIGYLIAAMMTQSFSSDLYSMPLVLKPATYAYSSLIVLGASLVAALIVRRRLDKLDLVAVMKTRE